MNFKLLFSLILLIGIWSCENSASTDAKSDDKKTAAHDHDHGSGDHAHGHGHDHGEAPKSAMDTTTLLFPGETHIANLKQLTFGGDNAEAYFSFDNKNLVFQASNEKWGAECDRIYTMPISGYEGEMPKQISNGKGRTTCSYYMPGNQEIIYSSTHLGNEACPNAPRSVGGKYVWGVFSDFDIFVADLDGNIKKQLTNAPGYDAEPTISPDGKTIVFTSTRSGDLELWTMNIDGSNKKQVTKGLGYDGGAFFSPDSKKLLFRASRPQTDEDQKIYKDFLKKDLVQPTNMELYICNVDGSDLKKITDLGGANWAPFFHPSGEKVIFASNHKNAGKGRPRFNLYMINLDGSGLEQITHDDVFDAFPMFSPDGKKLVFSSNRNNGG
ncbi:MAG: TolB family protein, partial [Saprospiraceae bacterium]